MMQDLAMQILEILMNSIQAGAKHILVKIRDSRIENVIEMIVQDDGKGMSPELAASVSDPFTTTRKTRRVGMGVAFLKGMTEQCNGRFEIESEVGKGTIVSASVQRDCIDTPEMGDLGEMMMDCISADDSIDYVLRYCTDQNEFVFESEEIRKQLAGVPLQTPEVLLWMKEYISEGIKQIKEENE